MANNNTIAVKFASNETKGKGSNLFIDGDTVYSYGYHFPISRNTGIKYKRNSVYTFNDRDYSISTQRHKSKVNSALSSKNYFIVVVPNAMLNKETALIQLNGNKKEIETFKLKLSRARTENSKEYIKNRIQYLNEQNGFLSHYLKKQ